MLNYSDGIMKRLEGEKVDFITFVVRCLSTFDFRFVSLIPG